jgi:hypothetical protein
MDVLKVFNLIVCNNVKEPTINIDILGLFVAPLTILIPNSRFAILAYLTIFIFWVLIYSSQSAIVKNITHKKDGEPSWLNALFSAILLYVFQTSIILLFLKFSVCQHSVEWENNDYHLTMQRYDNEYELNDGY